MYKRLFFNPASPENGKMIKLQKKQRQFDKKNITCKAQSFYILFAFLLITIHYIIDSFQYLLLSDKIQGKEKIYYHFMSQVTNKQKFLF